MAPKYRFIEIRLVAIFVALFTFSSLLIFSQDLTQLHRNVEIRRTEFGVPHIRATDLKSAFFGLAYCHAEDYGERVPRGLLEARGELARWFGPSEIEADFSARPDFLRAVASYHLLDPDIRAVFEGYAEGVNRYIRLHPDEMAVWSGISFTGHDVAARWVAGYNRGKVRDLVGRLQKEKAPPSETGQAEDEGSNAWAFAPSRTASGKAILLRNPHLSWEAGYYEAQVTVPGVLNFYGDLRVGAPIVLVGGFNDSLGWATTNNYPDLEEIYALDVDPERPDHYLFDGGSVPLQRDELTIEVKNGEGIGLVTRETWTTPLGPVVHRGGGKICVVKAGGDGETRGPLQFLRMMQATSFEQWREALSLRAHGSSNFTYADREGNIAYFWNATIPELPYPPVRDESAVLAGRSDEVWTQLVPFDRLPLVKNPAAGALQNANDPFHFPNLHQTLRAEDFPPNFPEPNLRLRSQLSLQLIEDVDNLTLEEVLKRKHTPRMLLAERVKGDLISAVRQSVLVQSPDSGEVGPALDLLNAWDNTANSESRGGTLFEVWFSRYLSLLESGDEPDRDELIEKAFGEPWSADRPLETPRGLSDPAKAVEAFSWAVKQTQSLYGGWDVTWGEVHRVRRGAVDVPVAGCPSFLGCFRALSFRKDDDGKLAASSGDGWILAVEFTDPIRALSILAYGQSSRPESPHHSDQASMFARGETKVVRFSEEDIERHTIRRYHPGEEIR